MKIITDETDGGTVGETPTPEPTLRQEAERARICDMYIAARLALDQSSKAAIACRVQFDAMRAYFSLIGFTPTEDELQRAARRLVSADGPPAPSIIRPS